MRWRKKLRRANFCLFAVSHAAGGEDVSCLSLGGHSWLWSLCGIAGTHPERVGPVIF